MSTFAVTWDYRCPFARNAHEHLAVALTDGADWHVTFLPFSLSQVHVPEGGTPVWDDPAKAPDLLALAAGVVVRDQYPDRFLDAHVALFAARHDEGLDLRVPGVEAGVLDASACRATRSSPRSARRLPRRRSAGPTSGRSTSWRCSASPPSWSMTVPSSCAS